MTPDVLLPGTGRYVSRSMVTILGVIMAVLLIGSVVAVVASFEGAFTNYVAIDAVLPAGANAPQLKSPVEYRDVTVGTVASTGHPVGNGQVSIVLHIKPSMMGAIPRSVQATVAPLSIFGNQYVDLQALHGTGGTALHSGQTIDAITRSPNGSLQATIADFYDVLSSIHPAQLEVTLAAVATALHGQGRQLGTTLSQASAYLTQMLPLLPTFENDLNLLAPVANDLSASTPAILGVLSNLTVTGRTLVSDQANLHQVLAGGAAVTAQGAQLMTAIAQPWEHLLIDSGPLLSDISQNANELADVLSGLDTWSKAWTAAESQGPYLSLTSTINVSNPADLVLATLGAPNGTALFAAGLGSKYVNPQTYTAADCPRYGGMAGRNCGGSHAAATNTAATNTAATNTAATSTAATASAAASGAATAPAATSTAATTNVGVLPEPAQSDAVATIAAGLDHGRPPASPAVATLLLGPVLDQMVQGS